MSILKDRFHPVYVTTYNLHKAIRLDKPTAFNEVRDGNLFTTQQTRVPNYNLCTLIPYLYRSGMGISAHTVVLSQKKFGTLSLTGVERFPIFDTIDLLANNASYYKIGEMEEERDKDIEDILDYYNTNSGMVTQQHIVIPLHPATENIVGILDVLPVEKITDCMEPIYENTKKEAIVLLRYNNWQTPGLR